MITASVSQTRRKLSELIELARNGEDVVIIKDSRPVAALRRIDASDLQLAIHVSDYQAVRLDELIDRESRKTFRTAAGAARFLKQDMAGKR